MSHLRCGSWRAVPLVLGAVLILSPGDRAFAQAGTGAAAPQGGAEAAPGAPSGFVGLSPDQFYDLDGRIARLEAQAQSLPSTERKGALSAIHAVKSEASFRRKKHGELRDWDIEHLQNRLNEVVQKYPALGR